MQKHLGFSLLELLVVLIIISILTTTAYPLYTAHVLKAHRTEATHGLLELSAKLELYHLVHHSYHGATIDNLQFNTSNTHEFYQFSITQADDETYHIQADPYGNQIKDKSCGSYYYNQAGEKNISGEAKISNCW